MATKRNKQLDAKQSRTTQQQNGVNTMENRFSSLLKQPGDQEWLLKLVSEAQEAEKILLIEENKVKFINENLARNRATIEALRTENKELEAQAEKASIDQYGAVNFSGFDTLSSKVFVNNAKIKKLEEVIALFEKKREYILIRHYFRANKELNAKKKEVYQFAGHKMLEEFLAENKEKLSRIYTLLHYVPINGGDAGWDTILKALEVSVQRDPKLKQVLYERSPLLIPESDVRFAMEYHLNYPRLRRTEELKKELGEE